MSCTDMRLKFVDRCNLTSRSFRNTIRERRYLYWYFVDAKDYQSHILLSRNARADQVYFPYLKYYGTHSLFCGRRHFDLLFRMVKYSFLALAALAMANMSTDAFAPKITSRVARTSLHAFAPPTMIIGPMIKRMREEQEKKKMPMASEQERAYEAPGLRVGSSAWKWPPV